MQQEPEYMWEERKGKEKQGGRTLKGKEKRSSGKV
jgi:hypothetical protein